jgi:hypothetical protein
MKTVNGFLMIDVGIRIVGTVIGVLFWPPLVSIGVLVAAIFGPNRLRRGPSLQCPTKVSSVCLSAALLFVYNAYVPQSGT